MQIEWKLIRNKFDEFKEMKLHLPNTISHSFENLVLLPSDLLQLICLARLFEINLDKMFPVTLCFEETDNEWI